MSLHLFAGLRVRDLQAARPWYERLLGEPTFFPTPPRPCGRSPRIGRSTSSSTPTARARAPTMSRHAGSTMQITICMDFRGAGRVLVFGLAALTLRDP